MKFYCWASSKNHYIDLLKYRKETEDIKFYFKACKCIIKHMKRKKIRFNSYYHINGMYGTPIVKHKGKLYYLSLSYYGWGRLMAEVEGKKDELSYLKWSNYGYTVEKQVYPNEAEWKFRLKDIV